MRADKLRVGDILSAGWTHTFYEVTKIIGDYAVEIREIAHKSVDVSRPRYNQDKCVWVPNPGKYINKPKRKFVEDDGRVLIDSKGSGWRVHKVGHVSDEFNGDWIKCAWDRKK